VFGPVPRPRRRHAAVPAIGAGRAAGTMAHSGHA